MAEWSNAAVLKTVILLRVSGVQIPLAPITEAPRCFQFGDVVERYYNGLLNRRFITGRAGSTPVVSAIEQIALQTLLFNFETVAQLDRVLACGAEGWGFELPQSH